MAHPAVLDGGEVVEKIDMLHAQVSAGQRELLRYVAECDRAGRWRRDGARDMAGWLSARFGLSNWAARRWVHAAHALEHLPHISAALAGGELCLDKSLELARFATAETEERLLRWARRVSAAAIRHKADLAQRRAVEDVRAADRERFVRWWWFDDGARLGLEAQFPAAHGAVIAKAVARLAERIPTVVTDDEATLGDDTLVEARRADALLAMASNAIATDADADRATVVVHTTAGDLGAEIAGGPVIDPSTERRLACDARIQHVETDGAGRTVGIGRTSRNVPPWLMRVLRARDRGCTFPGCGMKIFLHAHHIEHWEEGGPTDIGNLCLVCPFHHKLVHEFGWNVELYGGLTEWFRPGGALYRPGPDPPRTPMSSKVAHAA